MMIAAAFVGGGLWGWLITYLYLKRGWTPRKEQIAEYMRRVVDLEELEEHEKLIKLRMERNRRKTTRFDSGPNARVMRMRLTKRRRK
jgi:hypothetical protein